MESLILQGSEKTPYISLNHNGDMVFSGVSMPIDAADFYFKVIEWFSDYYREPQTETVITISFRYLNSSSESMIFKLFYCLDRLVQWNKSNVKCYWYYEESDETEILDCLGELGDVAGEQIYLMPEGAEPAEIQEHAQACAACCVRNGWRYTPRAHIAIYGNERGT